MSSTTSTQPSSLASGERYLRLFEGDDWQLHKVPAPIYRHATPSAPWPWMKLHADASEVPPVPPGLPGKSGWHLYPQSLFENWTHDQVERCQMLTKCSDHEASTVYKLTVFDDGRFGEQKEVRHVRRADDASLRAYWDELEIPPPSNVRVQALFVEDMSLPVLQMLGTRYNIEPFFFASSVNWIPSRYQEDSKVLEDHITVILPFVRCLKNKRPITRTKRRTRLLTFTSEFQPVEQPLPYTLDKTQIDTQAPLSLPDNKIILQDLLSLHMVRSATTSTMISYHPDLKVQRTSAKRLRNLVQRMGDSVYWSKNFQEHRDPTLLFLGIQWYALYSWDEAFEVLFCYINALETDVLRFQDIKLTRELHTLQAHILYYEQLLRDFRRSVEFVRDTPNPAMSAPWVSKAEREDTAKLLRREANNLITEIERLTQQRELMFERLDNAIHLAFSTVNIEESKATKELAEITMRDSLATKQIAYLTVVFLPATFLANVFSMNVKEINPGTSATLAQFIEAVVGFTSFTCWLVVALQKDSFFFPPGSGVLRRTMWPLFYVTGVISTCTKIKPWLKSTNYCSPPALPSYHSSEKGLKPQSMDLQTQLLF